MNTNFNPAISEETLAAWLDGNVSPAQDAYISQVCSVDPDMREIMAADSQVEDYYDHLTEVGYDMPEELLGDFVLPHVDEYNHENIEKYPDHDVEVYPDENDDDNDCAYDHHHIYDDSHDDYIHSIDSYDDDVI